MSPTGDDLREQPGPEGHVGPGSAPGAGAGAPDTSPADWARARERIDDVLLGGPRRYTRHEVRERSGLSPEHATRLWNALGFPTMPDDLRGFTDADVEALQLTASLLDEGAFDEAEELAVARLLGQTLGRLADWQAHLMRRRAVADGQADPAALVRSAEDLVPALERLQSYSWRRHLAASAARMLSDATRASTESDNVTTVGFADIVGFTTKSRKISDVELRALLDRFEGRSTHVVARHGGRIVKSIGDEVLFVVDDLGAALETGLDLRDEVPDAEGHLQLRIGMAHGVVIPRYGDVYGPTVNLASRLTSHARPGTVLVDDGLGQAVRDLDPDGAHYELRRVPTISVRGYAHLRPHALRRPSD